MSALNRAMRCVVTPGRVRERGFLLFNWTGETVQWAARASTKAARRGLRPIARMAGPSLVNFPLGPRLLGFIAGRAGARRYLRPGLTPADFAREMNVRGIRYVVLRWWQDFPELAAGEDIDLLVADEDYDQIDDFFADFPAGTACDVYNVSGSGRGHYRALPYFPPALAEALLNERRCYRDLVMVPGERTYFAALAYHAVFHKGARSGLPDFGVRPADLEHDYEGALRAAGQAAGISAVPTVEGLVKWLSLQGFLPGRDTLGKLIELRPELQMLGEPLASDIRGGELCVFVIRERAERKALTERFVRTITDRRIEILRTLEIPHKDRRQLATRIRGGKWDQGPYPLSGGNPASVIVGYDYHPHPPTSAQAKANPRVTNCHVLEAKLACRNIVRRTQPFTHFFNGIHSADNEQEAFDYVGATMSQDLADIRAEVERRRQRHAVRYPVHAVLSKGRRAKVELIEFRGDLAIKKTFRIGSERFLERELLAARDLAGSLSFIPPLLEAGEGYLIVPFFRNILREAAPGRSREILQGQRSVIFGIIKQMFERGLAYIDFHPQNIIITDKGELFSVDYEFLQPYRDRPTSLDEAYEVKGVPAEFSGDLPVWAGREDRSFDRVWRPLIGPWREIRQQYA